MNKKEIRKKQLQLRNEKSEQEINFLSEKVFANFLTVCKQFDCSNVFVYNSFGSEVNTRKFIDHFLHNNCNVYVPKIVNDKMVAVKINSSTKLVKGKFGILEPVGKPCNIQNFLCIAPALAVSKNGTRVGYGKGYYDEFLKNKNSVNIVLAYDDQLVSDIKPDEHDILMNVIITNKEIIYTQQNKEEQDIQQTKCFLCPRKCGINRQKNVGFCGVSNTLKVARAQLHFWEEPIISGTQGSGTIFFSGCNLQCVYCQNHAISGNAFGKEITVKRLAEIFKELEQKGAHNINLVTPSHYVNCIIEALEIYKPRIPIVYNTSGYDSVETISKLSNYVDVYLTDLKYVSPELSKKYSNAENYFEVASAAIKEMLRQQPKNVIEHDIIKKGVVIRHMVLPNCSTDSVEVLKWIKQNAPNAIVSIMGQFTPCHKCNEHPEINRKIKPIEYKRVINKFVELGLQNGYCQELSSATEDYIPPFNLEGV